MDKPKFYVDMPDEISVENQINTIVEKGLKKRESFYSYIKNMYKKIGLRYLFHDATEIIFAILLIFSIFMMVIINGKNLSYMKNENIYVFITIASPILYLVISLISFVGTKEKGTYEIEMTCKYNLYQLAAFRMFVFSVGCILFNVIFIGVITFIYEKIEFLRAFMISITALFLFSSIFLYLIIVMKSIVTKYLVIIGWIGINLVMCVLNIEFYTKVLMSLPMIVYAIVTAACIYFYIRKLKKLISFTSVKGVM